MGHISKQELLKAKAIIDQFFIETGKEITVNELFNFAYEGHWKDQNTAWSKEVLKIYERAIKPFFGEARVSKIKPVIVRRWHRRFQKSPTSGNRALAVLSRMFSYGEEYDHVPLGQNPCSVVKPFPEKKRGRFATTDEVVKIIKVLNEDMEKYKPQVTFLFLLLYTGTRPSVLENAKWDHLDLVVKDGRTFGILTLPGKSTAASGQDEQVVIPPQALKLLKGFSAERLDGKILGIKIPHHYWKSVIKRVGCEGLWIRDFRRTFATIAKSSGESMDVIGDLLNHKCHETTKIYAKLTSEKRIDAVSNIADCVERMT